MPRFLYLHLLCSLPVILSARADVENRQPPVFAPFLEKHCYECHDDLSTKGGLNLADLAFDPDNPTNLATWAKVHDQVQSGAMPPEKQTPPENRERAEFIGQMSDLLTKTWQARYTTKQRVT